MRDLYLAKSDSVAPYLLQANMRTFYRFGLAAALLILSASVGIRLNAAPADPGWDAKAAAAYLDGRAEWWTTWPNAARDRGTYCMSCHTTLPYALARP